jgi:O-antigen ligase
LRHLLVPAGFALVALMSVTAGAGAAQVNGTAVQISSLLSLLAALVLALALPAEWIFLGWFALAPFLQELLIHPGIGNRLDLLYRGPPLILLFVTLVRRAPRKRGRWYDILPGLYLGYVILALAVSHWVPATSITYRTMYYTTGIGILLYYVTAFGIPDLKVRSLAHVLFGSGALVAFVAIIQAATGWSPWADNGWTADNRVVGPLQNPAVIGTFLGAVVAMAVAAHVWEADRTTKKLAALATVPSLVAIGLTYTRSSILAAIVVALLIGMTRLRARLVTLGVVLFAALLIAASWGRIATTSAYQDRFSNRTNVQARVLIQDWSIELAKRRPVFGWGYGSFDQVKNSTEFGSTGGIPASFGRESTSHNTFLTVLVELGLLGILLFLTTFVIVLARAVPVARKAFAERWFFIGAIGTVLVYILNATSIDMRFFSFVPALAFVFLGLIRRFELIDAAEGLEPAPERL